MAKKKLVKKGKWWFRGIKRLMTMRYKAPQFIFLDGKEFENGSLILSNHEGTDAPMSLEMYLGCARNEFGTYKNVQVSNSRVLSRKKALEFTLGKIVLLACKSTNQPFLQRL